MKKPDYNVTELRYHLENLLPEHDSELGLIHPYWARKPLNVCRSVIQSLSAPGDLVLDPFMGSGTLIFAALLEGRRAFGNDISVLSEFIVQGTLQLLSHPEILIPEIERLLLLHREKTLSWYWAGEEKFVERVRFNVTGTYTYGDFSLDPTEIVTKSVEGTRWFNRQVITEKDLLPNHLPQLPQTAEKYLRYPVDFESIPLEENSRIAIPKGAKLGHYFTPENRASINFYRVLAQESSLYKKFPEALLFLLSSSIPQLRLSDKKASSQWPYWRPKSNLTSRNPVAVFNERFKRIIKLINWGKSVGINNKKIPEYLTFSLPAQDLSKAVIGEPAQLVFADPPYGDQVPYGEYASLWESILGLKKDPESLKKELVISNSKMKGKTAEEYPKDLFEIFVANSQILADEGFLVWFYQDQDLRNWKAIFEASKKTGMILQDIIAIPKQRRSMKTVTSPNRTLDGDLLCIFQKTDKGPQEEQRQPVQLSIESETYFSRYTELIVSALKDGTIGDLATKYRTVSRALKSLEG